MEISDGDIEEILAYTKGPNSFFVLSVLYPNLKFDQVEFHQDHIHPESFFTDRKLREADIPQENWAQIKALKNTLPNLQIMEGKENKIKNDTVFSNWLNNPNNVPDVEKFKKDNFIPSVNFEFKNFENFCEQRKTLLKTALLNFINN